MTNRRHNKTYHHQLKWKCQVCWALVVKLPTYKVYEDPEEAVLTLPTVDIQWKLYFPDKCVDILQLLFLPCQLCGHPVEAVPT